MQGNGQLTLLHIDFPSHHYYIFFLTSKPCDPYFLDFVFPFKWSKRDVKGMCQWLLAFLKEIFFLSTTSIASSKNSIVHVPCYYRVERLFSLATFFVCATSVGGVFSLSDDSESNIPLHRLQGTLTSIMVVFCLLTPISSKLAKYTLNLKRYTLQLPIHISKLQKVC
jgi:hypothetical protein